MINNYKIDLLNAIMIRLNFKLRTEYYRIE